MKSLKVNTKKIGSEIKRLGVSQAEFATRCGISRQLLHFIISTKRSSFNTIAQIADAMGVDPKDLLE